MSLKCVWDVHAHSGRDKQSVLLSVCSCLKQVLKSFHKMNGDVMMA